MISILCVGSLKEDWQRAACADYLKRLSRLGKYEVIEVKDEPEPGNSSPAIQNEIIKKEGRAIISRLKPGDRVIALCIEANMLSSPALAKKTADWAMSGRRTVLVIGGSLGLSKEVTDLAEEKISFSPMTFPHTLMRVILLEQLYRAAKINAGERYHK